MRLYCLSDDPNTPCFVLSVHGRSILLDFPLVTDHIVDYLPVATAGVLNRFSSSPKYDFVSNNKDFPSLVEQINELRIVNNRLYVYSPIEFYTLDSSQYDFSLIDIILISNYETLLGLPFLYKNNPKINAQIYLTEPSFRFGQQLMFELVSYVEPQTKMIRSNDRWRFDPDIFDSIENEKRTKNLKIFACAQKLKTFYSSKDVDRCLKNAVIVHFDEQVDLYSSIRATALSSGYCLGSCNWVLDLNVNHNQTSKIETSTSIHLSRFVYMSTSTTLESYSSKFQYESFSNCDYLLATNLFRPSTMDASVNANELTNKIEKVLNDHGTVLIPCSSAGLIFHMFEFLTRFFEQTNLLQVQMYFISPVSNANLLISNAMSEWVNEQRQTASFTGTQPFKHNELLKNKSLITISSDRLDDTENLINFEQPSIIFTGHPSLRFGPVVQLIEKLKNSPSNAIIFVENTYPYLEALTPYQPVQMKCFNLPIDTRLNFSQLNILLNEKIRPKCLVVHDEYKNEINYDQQSTITYRKYDNLKLPSISPPFIAGQLNIQQNIKPKLISSSANLAIASVHGHLDMHDYVYEINDIDQNLKETTNSFITYGHVDIDKFLMNLSKNGLFGLEIRTVDDPQSMEDDDDDEYSNQNSNRSVDIIYNNGLAHISIRSRQTDIRCNDPHLMNKIRDALLSDNIGTL